LGDVLILGEYLLINIDLANELSYDPDGGKKCSIADLQIKIG
jgi:hypothetical protein